MERIKLGTVVKPLGINRSAVAEGVKAKGILIEKDPRFKNTAYDDKVKRSIEVDQDSVIKYKLDPRANYYFLHARLNTDMKGNVIGDDFIVEFVTLSEGLYNDYLDSIEALGMETGHPNGLLMTKVKKTVNGKDYSYVKVIAANIKATPALKEKLTKLRADKKALEALWEMVDNKTSINIVEYEKLLLAEEGGESAPRMPRTAISAPEGATAMIESETNEFDVDAPDFEDTDEETSPEEIPEVDDFAETTDFEEVQE